MKKKKAVTSLILIVMSVVFFSSGYMVYAMNDNSKTEEQTIHEDPMLGKIDREKLRTPEPAMRPPVTQAIEFDKPVEKEAEFSEILVTGDIVDKIKNSDKSKFDKNIAIYEKTLVQLDVPQEFRGQIENLLKKDKKIQNILPIYNFLYDNYGTIDELDKLVVKLDSGGNLADIITEYDNTSLKFVPRDFEDQYLKKLMETLSVDDIMIADRLSQKGVSKFEDLIARRQSGESWKTINSELGVINTSDQFPKVSLTRAQVNKCMQDNGLNENDAMNVLVMTSKTGKDYATVTSELKNGKKKETIYAEAYTEKYK
ncbi:hypothetical protein [Desulfosporosinus shakirovi]|uniref:hypothetical protein n=1 Tax=Desulfosporosinus shakirovi TaxID=2885154 RepID=UPI001E2C1E0D|nr:hypothetical protein [Desulfosporosinus sp. SRJS8]MCB8818801.1 hypothetical protein [Desulfosporosinus sp. SRJS8]